MSDESETRMDWRKLAVKTERQGSVDIAYVGGQDGNQVEMGQWVKGLRHLDLFKGIRVGVNLCAVMVTSWPFRNKIKP